MRFYLVNILFFVRRSTIEGLFEDWRAPPSFTAELCEGGHGVLAGQVLAPSQGHDTLSNQTIKIINQCLRRK